MTGSSHPIIDLPLDLGLFSFPETREQENVQGQWDERSRALRVGKPEAEGDSEE